MDYEQKYKEALERAKEKRDEYKRLDGEESFVPSDIEYIFPELRESEDESIRKEMIDFLKETIENVGESPNIWTMNNAKKWLAWLEKQGRQKPSDKIEPKFKIGDWITNGEYTWKVIDIKPLDYLLQSQNGDVVDDTISYVDEEFHLWTIQDAKDGDVLMANAPFIFNGNLEGGIGCPGAHCGINTLGKFQIPKYQEHWTGHTTTPATKEQRDLLFKKMEEVGYEWDTEKKELKKIEQESTWNEKIKGLNELETYILSLVPDRSLDAIKVYAKNIRYIINKE